MLEIKDLYVSYGMMEVLHGVSVKVEDKELVSIIGPNGAGKTTWMMSVAGFLHVESGQIDLLGNGFFDPAVHAGRITILPQDSELPPESRPLELLTHYGLLQGLTRQEAGQSAAAMLNEVHLGDRLHAPIRSLSHGMRKRVMIAQCFLGYPEVVLLDEPLSGLDPREVAHMRAFLTRRRGRQTLVISSHNLHDIEVLCDHVAFIEKGRAVRLATLEELLGKASTLVYALTAEPADYAPLATAVPDATLTFDAAVSSLICKYDPHRATPGEINSRLLPALLPQCGVTTITCGANLETEYLKNL